MKYKKARKQTITTIHPSGKERTKTFNLDDPDDQPMLFTFNVERINEMWQTIPEEEQRLLLLLLKETDLVGEPPYLREP